MSVGVNVAPGWSDTVYGRNLPQMYRCLEDLKPDVVRMPWVANQATVDAAKWAIDRGIDVVVEDNRAYTVQQELDQLAWMGLPVFVEGLNEPGTQGLSYEYVQARQTELYETVAGRWPVLSPAAAVLSAEPGLLALPHDISSVHRYAGDNAATAGQATLPDTGRPVWVTETGYPSYKTKQWGFWPMWAVSEKQQRDRLADLVSRLRGNGAARVVVYGLEDTGPDIYNREQNYGLYRQDGTAKPAAVALRSR